MALTYAAQASEPWPVPRAMQTFKAFPVTITFDASYPTGGLAVTPSALGLARVDAVIVSVDAAGTRLAVWDAVNGKIKVFSALGTEVTNATNLSAVTFNALVVGV